MIEGMARKILYASLYDMSTKRMKSQTFFGAPNHNKLRLNRYRKSLRKAKTILESFHKCFLPINKKLLNLNNK